MIYAVYSHTDYIDILNVHSNFLKFGKHYLIINTNLMNLSHIYDKYDKVIFYDDELPYASRLLQSLKQIDSEYFLLIHDMDIPLQVDNQIMESLYQKIISDKLDRIDLQQEARIANNEQNDYNFIEINKNLFLVKNDSIKHGIYNVNPSLWNKKILEDILNTFPNRNYRNIEAPEIQNYCLRYNFYKLNVNNWINAGYYRVTPYFQFLHLTHGGGLLPIENNNCDASIQSQYIDIVNNYKFNREIKKYMY